MGVDDELDTMMAMIGVRPLRAKRRPQTPGARAPEPVQLPAPEPDAEAEFAAAMAAVERIPDKDQPGNRGPTIAPVQIQLPRRLVLHPDEQIDLHGLTRDDATRQLARFVSDAARIGQRTLLVITGRGRHSTDGVSVVRSEVETWIGGV